MISAVAGSGVTRTTAVDGTSVCQRGRPVARSTATTAPSTRQPRPETPLTSDTASPTAPPPVVSTAPGRRQRTSPVSADTAVVAARRRSSSRRVTRKTSPARSAV
jgi:hypothetical protein